MEHAHVVSAVALSFGLTMLWERGASGQPLPAFPADGAVVAGYQMTRLSEPQQSSWHAFCNGVDIGTVSVQYGLLSGSGRRPPPVYGPWINWGFQRNDNDCCEEPEYEAPGTQYRWIQTVVTNDALSGQPANTAFVDYDRRQQGNPFYSQRDVGASGFTTSTMDWPRRFLPGGTDVTYWEAVTTLVCTYDHHIGLIDSFTWGFVLTSDGIYPIGPVHQGTPSQSVLDTIRADANSAGYQIDIGCCCIPSPGWGGPFTACLVMAARRRTRAA